MRKDVKVESVIHPFFLDLTLFLIFFHWLHYPRSSFSVIN